MVERKSAICMISVRAVAVSSLLALIVSCVAPPSVEECRLIVVDMPHGGRRIAIEPDGSGTYAYGALPAMGRFGTGTFDFRDVYGKLRSVAQPSRRESGEVYGTVQFLTDGQSESALHLFYDRELVTVLLATAFDNRAEPENAVESDIVQALNEIWLAEETEAP
ncbi:MAG: hypothetical protein WBG05_19600 [Thermoanaerobaculia bacterium]